MSQQRTESTTAEAALDGIIAAMRTGQERAFNARRILAAIQRGDVPGVTFDVCMAGVGDHESAYMTEDDGRTHWRCLRCGQITEPEPGVE